MTFAGQATVACRAFKVEVRLAPLRLTDAALGQSLVAFRATVRAIGIADRQFLCALPGNARASVTLHLQVAIANEIEGSRAAAWRGQWQANTTVPITAQFVTTCRAVTVAFRWLPG